ncbi:MAG: HAD hydrolase-like protein [Acidimicrobiia bacterium]
MRAEHNLGALVLDWNGTVVDDLDRAMHATNIALAAVGTPSVTLDEFRDRFRLPMTAFFSGLGVPASALESAVSKWNAAMVAQPSRLSTGARELLSACASHGMPAGVLSAADPKVIASDVERLELDGLLAFVRGNASDKAADLCSLSQRYGAVMYVGDTTDDVVAGHGAGVLTVAYARGYHHRSRLAGARPHALVDELSEIIGLLRQLPDGVARTRTGLAASLRVEPYETAVMPQKSTYFFPKLALGLFLHPI